MLMISIEMSSSIDCLVFLLNGLNYLIWKTQISSFLKINNLWGIVGGTQFRPRPLAVQTAIAATMSTSGCSAITEADVIVCQVLIDAWDDKDMQAAGCIQLHLAHSLHIHVKASASGTWVELEDVSGKLGALLIFADFKSAVNFQLTGGNLVPEISKFFMLLECLKTNKVKLPAQVQAMLLLGALPNKWDNVAAMVLKRTQFNDFAFEPVCLAIVSEYE